MRRLVPCLIALWSTLSPATLASAQVTFTPLEVDLSVSLGLGGVGGVSHDGSTVVGGVFALDPQLGPTMDAVLWVNGQPVSLGLPSLSYAEDVSGDGSVLVGLVDSFTHFQLVDGVLDTFGPTNGGQPFGVSADGSTIVGHLSNAGTQHAYRYRNGVVELLDDLEGGQFKNLPFAASSDGSVLAGYGATAAGSQPVTWDDAGNVTALPLPAGFTKGTAYDLSYDGAVVVGAAEPGGNASALRWVNQQVVELGTLGGPRSWANGVSAEGSIVVGRASVDAGAGNYGAFIWDETNGIRSLQALLEQLGADLSDWTLTSATDVSGDGRSILGYADHDAGYRSGFVATVPEGQGAGAQFSAWVQPLPEPGHRALFLAGVAALQLLQRRRMARRGGRS